MQDYRDGFVSVLFIECEMLRAEFPDCPACCSHCHDIQNEKTHRIYVRPIGHDGLNADWYLCTEAIVCCALYHFVRALPYSWWEAKAVEFKVKREDVRGYIYPAHPEKNTEQPHVAKTPSQASKTYRQNQAKQESAREKDREESGGLRGWLK